MPGGPLLLVVRRPWLIAGALSTLAHLPLFVVVSEPAAPPPPDVVTIELATYRPGPELPAEEPSAEQEPAAPEPPAPRARTPPKPREPTEDEPVAEPSPPPLAQRSADPAPADVASSATATSATESSEPSSSGAASVDGGGAPGASAGSGAGSGKLGDASASPPDPAPPPSTRFDPRAYRGLAFGHVDQHKRYPRKARVLGQQGEVLLLLYLDEEGRLLRDPKVQRSSGVDVLDEEAVRMVKAAAPFPKPEGEVSRVPILVPLTIHFRLEDP